MSIRKVESEHKFVPLHVLDIHYIRQNQRGRYRFASAFDNDVVHYHLLQRIRGWTRDL